MSNVRSPGSDIQCQKAPSFLVASDFGLRTFLWLWVALVILLLGACTREEVGVEKVKRLLQARDVERALSEYQHLWQSTGDAHPKLLSQILQGYLMEEIEAGGDFHLRAASLLARLSDPSLLPVLYRVASKGDPGARTVAIETIHRLDGKGSEPFLLSLIHDPDPHASSQAVRVLGRLGSRAAKVSLSALLDDTYEMVRVAAAEALTRLGEHQAFSLLLQALRSSEVGLRLQAAEALGSLGHREAIPALVQTLKDQNGYVRLYAAEALARLGEGQGRGLLRRAVEDGPLSLRLYAAEALANLGDSTPLPFLQGVMADPRSAKEVRLYAAWILGRLHDPSGISHIRTLLQDEDPYIRRQAAWTLGEIGDPVATPLLREALADRERVVRIHAAWALTQLFRQRPPPGAPPTRSSSLPQASVRGTEEVWVAGPVVGQRPVRPRRTHAPSHREKALYRWRISPAGGRALGLRHPRTGERRRFLRKAETGLRPAGVPPPERSAGGGGRPVAL